MSTSEELRQQLEVERLRRRRISRSSSGWLEGRRDGPLAATIEGVVG